MNPGKQKDLKRLNQSAGALSNLNATKAPHGDIRDIRIFILPRS